jgi:transcriptional regulator with XRE-family HTH domain
MASGEQVQRGVGERVRSAREAKGLTQERLGELLGVTKGQVSRYENELSPITTDRLQQIARALGVPAASLLP